MTAPTAEPIAGHSPSTGTRPPLWQNSALAFVLAALVAVVLHEASHAVAGMIQGEPAVLYPFQVDFPGPRTTGEQIATAATGPLFSLVLGVLVLVLGRRAGRGFGRLFALWLGFISAENFMGYLVITPFGHVGDTGKVLHLLGAPQWAAVCCCAVGVAGILTLSWLFMRRVLRYVRDVTELRAIGLLAWLAGTAVTVARTVVEAQLSGIHGATIPPVIAGAVAVGIFAPIMTPFYRRFRVDYEPLSLSRPTVPLLCTAALIALDLIFLTGGIRL